MSAGRTHVIRLVGAIGDHRTSITLDEVDRAIAPRTRVDEGLLISLDHGDGSAALYTLGAQAVSQKVAGFLEHRVSTSDTHHLSVFGFAPMPLLMLLGRTLGDKQPAEVYERHRHSDSWCWEPEGAPLEWTATFPARMMPGRAVALLLSISNTIDSVAVSEAMAGDFDLVELSVPLPQRVPNIVRTRAHLRGFAETWRSTLNRIKTTCEPARVHVFPAAPLSVCIEAGRRLLPKADPELVLYDRFGSRFFRSLNLEGPASPAAPTGHGEAPRKEDWRLLLYALFTHGFTNTELSWLLDAREPGFSARVKPAAVSRQEFVFDVIDALQRRGLIDDEFFRVVRNHFSSRPRRLEVDAIQAAWNETKPA